MSAVVAYRAPIPETSALGGSYFTSEIIPPGSATTNERAKVEGKDSTVVGMGETYARPQPEHMMYPICESGSPSQSVL